MLSFIQFLLLMAGRLAACVVAISSYWKDDLNGILLGIFLAILCLEYKTSS